MKFTDEKQSINLGKLDFRDVYVDDFVNYIIKRIAEQYKKGEISESQAHQVIKDIKNEFVFQIKYNKRFFPRLWLTK